CNFTHYSLLFSFTSPALVLSFISFFFYCSGDHRDLHSFPTRRSSDLIRFTSVVFPAPFEPISASTSRSLTVKSTWSTAWVSPKRSEEHTSELQSRGHLVCRLLLEKKKITSRTRIPAAMTKPQSQQPVT